MIGRSLSRAPRPRTTTKGFALRRVAVLHRLPSTLIDLVGFAAFQQLSRLALRVRGFGFMYRSSKSRQPCGDITEMGTDKLVLAAVAVS